MPKTRIIFSSDFHGSDVVWRKFLNSASMFNANVLLMGGDMTSKVMVPIVREPEGGYTANFLGKEVKISEQGLPDLKKQIRQHCYLPYVCSKAEVEKLSRDQEYVEKVFEDLEVEMVKDWLSLIPKKAPDVRVIIHPGNDDKFVLDDVLRNSPNIVFAEESVVRFDDRHEAACVGWSNPTPWHSPRECTEEQLLEKLEKTVSQLKSVETSCFCFHVPPYNSTIDMAPKLDATLRPVYEGGRPAFIPVGSKSVRRVIEKYQPLLGLHGHIHESPGLVKIGKTQCINPGSEYSEGILRAYIIELEDGKAKRLQRLEG
ncbi:metallophosphoesterase [Candidatus Bathyarchaeota archaeon]|nr:MAG: metallophosphoesterase [Candidatus Bathyarchaeota archaeon]TMI53407.1 MAG: metallophosphoesterase [Candidatus Bathyarchaeota archaeon]